MHPVKGGGGRYGTPPRPAGQKMEGVGEEERRRRKRRGRG